MDRRQDQGEPRDDKQGEERAEEAVKELDEIPPPGTDPLHEGP